MFTLLRFAFTTLWLIFTALIFPQLQLGGRYQILFIAFLITGMLKFFEDGFSKKTNKRIFRLLAALVACGGLLLARIFLPNIYLTPAGMILFYLGMMAGESMIKRLKEGIGTFQGEV